MINVKEILNEANTWIGTPFKHQGRLKGVGVDCYGLLIEIGRHFNLSDYKSGGYNKQPDSKRMLNALNENLIKVSLQVL